MPAVMGSNMESIPCPRCGESLPAGAPRCDACGAYVVQTPGSGAASPRVETAGGRHAASGRGGGAWIGVPRGTPGIAWLLLVVGLFCGGGIGYALRGAVGPRQDGGMMPKGPSDVMGGGASGGSMEGGGMGGAAMSGAMGGGQAGGAQMPPQVVAMVKQYKDVLAKNPDDITANIGLGNLLFDSGQWDRAIEHYQRALDKTPKNADVRIDMAICYHNLGQNDRAMKEMLRVTREEPTHKNAWLNLGVVKVTLGDRPGAIKAWEQYLKIDPGGSHADAIKTQIEELKKGL